MQEEKYDDKKQNTEPLKKGRFTSALVSYALIAAFVLLTAGAGIYTFVTKDRSFSESENRMLSQKPVFTSDSLIDGSFMSDFEGWLSDQFPLRDEAIVIKTDFDRLTGKKEENGVYIGKNNRLFEVTSEYDKKKIAEKTDAINSFLAGYPDINKIVAIVPNSSFVYPEDLPDFISADNQQEQIEDIYNALSGDKLETTDTVSALYGMKEDNTELYYKTDHHWTTRAAYGVFLQIADAWELDTEKEYSFYTVTDSFEGTLASRSGVHDVTDTIEICVPENSVESYTVNYESVHVKNTTLFNESKLSTKNKYEVFLGGNYDKISIETTAPGDQCLLIIKDSYANCMIPMFTPYFSQIVVIDPRYMTESVDTLMSEYNFTHVLLLYNLNIFNSDSALCDVLCPK